MTGYTFRGCQDHDDHDVHDVLQSPAVSFLCPWDLFWLTWLFQEIDRDKELSRPVPDHSPNCFNCFIFVVAKLHNLHMSMMNSQQFFVQNNTAHTQKIVFKIIFYVFFFLKIISIGSHKRSHLFDTFAEDLVPPWDLTGHWSCPKKTFAIWRKIKKKVLPSFSLWRNPI